MLIQLKGDTEQDTTTGKNLANITVFPNSNVLTVANDVMTLANNLNKVGFYGTGKTLAQLCPSLEVGGSYVLSYISTSSSTSANRIYLSGKNIAWYNNETKTIDQDMLNSNVAIYGGYNETAVISEFMIRLSSITDTSYEPYTRWNTIS